MTTSDIDEALKVLNIEPLYGHSNPNPPAFRKAGGPHPAYFVEDEEIDFDRVIKEEKIFLPKGASYTAHWLAVEGVQPLVPENPPALPRETEVDDKESAKPTTNGVTEGTNLPTPPGDRATSTTFTNPLKPGYNIANVASGGKQPAQSLVKQVLSRELQLYYARLTASLLPPADETKRTAALASLRHDAGLQPLLPYLIRWVGEGVVGTLKNESPSDSDGTTLEVLIQVLSSLLQNTSLLVEFYLHQVLPSLLSTLLTSTLPSNNGTHLRILASQVISHILTRYSTSYPSLGPRIMKTLLIALLAPSAPPKTDANGTSTSPSTSNEQPAAPTSLARNYGPGTREGAVRGLMSIGREAIYKGLIEGGALHSVGEEVTALASSSSSSSLSPSSSTTVNPTLAATNLSNAIVDALDVLIPPSKEPEVINVEDEEESKMADDLKAVCGSVYGMLFLGDKERAKQLLAMAGG